jgi:hypothetical protein
VQRVVNVCRLWYNKPQSGYYTMNVQQLVAWRGSCLLMDNYYITPALRSMSADVAINVG